MKHRVVETMNTSTADALGLSRAILCNGMALYILSKFDKEFWFCFCTDGLVKKLEELEKTAQMYQGLSDHTKRLLKAFFELSQAHRGTQSINRSGVIFCFVSFWWRFCWYRCARATAGGQRGLHSVWWSASRNWKIRHTDVENCETGRFLVLSF